MLFQLSDWAMQKGNMALPHRGYVVDNNDPRKIGRVRVTITGLLEGATAALPWIYPKNATFLGGSANSSSFAVPEIGSLLVIEFPYTSVYFGFYTGYWHSAQQHNPSHDEDYPNSYGFKDSKGNVIVVNKATGDLKVNHHSGTLIHILNDGTIKVEGINKLDMKLTSDAIIEVGGNADIKVAGTTSVESTGEATVKAPMINLNP